MPPADEAKAKPDDSDLDGMSFEDAMRELESIVQRLESGEIGLEESIEIYGRGARLKQYCEAKLKAAQSKVEKIVSAGDPDQAPETEPFDVD